MFDSGATVFFAIFMAFWGKLHALCHLDSFNFDYPPACHFPCFITFVYQQYFVHV